MCVRALCVRAYDMLVCDDCGVDAAMLCFETKGGSCIPSEHSW